MRIVHVYAQNLEIFADMVEGTDCRICASSNIDDVFASLYNFNARDVIGLVIFANPFTKKCAKLVRAFDQLFVFSQMPIVIVADNASELVANYLRVKHSELLAVNSDENSISDTDLKRIFATLVIKGIDLYDLSVCGLDEESIAAQSAKPPVNSLEISDELKQLLEEIHIT